VDSNVNSQEELSLVCREVCLSEENTFVCHLLFVKIVQIHLISIIYNMASHKRGLFFSFSPYMFVWVLTGNIYCMTGSDKIRGIVENSKNTTLPSSCKLQPVNHLSEVVCVSPFSQ